MHFQLTDEQTLIKETLARFLADRYDLARRRQYLALPDGFSRDNWREISELGLVGLALPDTLGGIGGSAVDIMIVMEEVGYHAAVEPFAAAFATGAALACADDKGEAERLAEGLIGGTLLVSPALLEGRESFAGSPTTTARAEAGGFRLKGAKRLVSHPSAELFLVSARTAAGPSGVGQQLFTVPGDAPGLSRSCYSAIDGAAACDLHLEDATVSRKALQVDVGNGAEAVERVATTLAFAGAAESVGVLRRLVEVTRDYLKTRVQFGKPLAAKQVVRHRIAEMYMHSELARSAVIGAAVRRRDTEEWRRSVSAAKVTVGAAADFIGKQAVQLHGGMGVSDEYEVSHAYKRLMVLKLLYGDARTHARRLGAIAA